MAWPIEAGSLGVIRRESGRRKKRPRRGRSQVFDFPARRPNFFVDGRGKYRVFNAAAYRFYRSATGPPSESDAWFDSNATLPDTPTDTYADGTWHVSCSYWNGCIDSGFLPLGPRGETYLRLDLSGGAEDGSPPAAPFDVRIEQTAGGVPRIVAAYYETGSNRAGEWAVGYTTDGTEPAEDSTDYTAAFLGGNGLAILDHDLSAQAAGTVVNIRVQVRRDDGGGDWHYSEGSTIKTLTLDLRGPTAPLDGRDWPGSTPGNY